jgi:NAD(P)-dependent dehydrogenase (short-subunit alcohol dehydrogenase family)
MSISGSTSQKGKVWFITGVSTGFGRLLAEYLVTLGANVVATARKPDQLKPLEDAAPAQVQLAELDVTKPDQIDEAIADAMARFSHIDVLVNNAGYGVTGAIEEVSEDEFMPMFETNVLGTIRMTKALLPHFRERRAGNILLLSSIGGLIGSAGWGFYNTTKFAVEGFGEALGQEMASFGVGVTIVEPGPFRTDFLGRSGVAAATVIPEYRSTAGKAREYFASQAGKQPGDPQRAVEAMVAAVEAPEPPRHLLLGKVALERYRNKIRQIEQEMNDWEETTVGADYSVSVA